MKEYGEATGAFKNKSVKSTPKIKTSWKNLVKRKVVNSTLLTSDKISKIPRATTATTITCVTARVDPVNYMQTELFLHDINSSSMIHLKIPI